MFIIMYNYQKYKIYKILICRCGSFLLLWPSIESPKPQLDKLKLSISHWHKNYFFSFKQNISSLCFISIFLINKKLKYNINYII